MKSRKAFRELKRANKRIIKHNFKILKRCMELINLIGIPSTEFQFNNLKEAINTFEETTNEMLSLAKKHVKTTEGKYTNEK